MAHFARRRGSARGGVFYGSRYLEDQKEVYEKHLEEQLNEGNSAYSKASKKAKKLRDCLMTVAEKVCDNEYSEKQLGGPNQIMKLSDAELRDFIIQNFYTQRQSMTETIAKLQKLYTEAKAERDSISQQFLQTEQKLKEAEARINDLEYAIEHSVPLQPVQAQNSEVSSEDCSETSQDPSPEVVPTDLPEVADPSSSSESNIVMMNGRPFDLAQVRKSLDVYQMGVLKVMGNFGCNDTSDIIAKAQEVSDISKEGKVRDALSNLKENGLVQDMKHPVLSNGVLNYLSEVGKAMFEYVYRKKPVIDEMSRIQKMHDNYDHGYYIKYTCKVLEKQGYTNVCMDAHKNAIQVVNGKTYIPDIIAEYNGRKTFWEVERGNHHDSDFFEKLDKAAVVSGGTVYVIGDSNETKTHLKEQINKYFTKKMKEKSKMSFEIVLGTYSELNRRGLVNNVANHYKIGQNKT